MKPKIMPYNSIEECAFCGGDDIVRKISNTAYNETPSLIVNCDSCNLVLGYEQCKNYPQTLGEYYALQQEGESK
jgi:hypothetical protein